MNYYEQLGIVRSASQDEIESAWKKLRIKHHPDKGGETQKFQEIKEAYETLSDPNRRRAYDNPQPQFQNFHFQSGGMDINEALRRAGFGGGWQQAPVKNPNLTVRKEITLEEAYRGASIDLHIPNDVTGETETIPIKLSPGVMPGARFRLQGKGSLQNPDLPRGDLDVLIFVKQSEDWDMQGTTLIKIININAIEAMIGTKKEFTHLSGKKYKISIPKGTSHGDKQRMPKLGMISKDFTGDMFVVFLVTIPAIDDAADVAALRKIQKSLEKETS